MARPDYLARVDEIADVVRADADARVDGAPRTTDHGRLRLTGSAHLIQLASD